MKGDNKIVHKARIIGIKNLTQKDYDDLTKQVEIESVILKYILGKFEKLFNIRFNPNYLDIYLHLKTYQKKFEYKGIMVNFTFRIFKGMPGIIIIQIGFKRKDNIIDKVTLNLQFETEKGNILNISESLGCKCDIEKGKKYMDCYRDLTKVMEDFGELFKKEFHA